MMVCHCSLLRIEYVYFFTLRNWGKSDSKLLHENVYIHAKVMICDDRKVIVGSANINDRSMVPSPYWLSWLAAVFNKSLAQLGTRDTEIAAVIEGLDHPSVMAGESFQVCRFAHALRMEIWRDALGVDIDEDEDLHDPVGPAAWHRLIRTANSNTKIYLDVFGKMPDTAHTLREHERTDIDMNEKPDALAKLEKVQGMVVNFALDFLKLESMNVPTFSKEKVVPRVVFL
jgi:phospholipase D1/2